MLTSADYIVELVNSFVCVGNTDDVKLVKKLVAFVELSVITFININSIKLYAKVQVFFTFLKIALCLGIIMLGLYDLCGGN